MPNSDDTYGTYNKQTMMHTQNDDGSTALTTFADVAAAQAYIYSTEALAVYNECATTIQWALVADGDGNNTGLKVTIDFGTKGTVGIAAADDWAGQFNSRQTALQDADPSNWIVIQDETGKPGFTVTDISSHLF